MEWPSTAAPRGGFIVIEGNIGAGKSTLLHGLHRLGYTVFREPLKTWKHWLRAGSDRAFFQCVVIAWYGILHRKALAGKRVAIERSAFTADYIFGDAARRSDLSRAYALLYERVAATAPPLTYVFLSDPPSVCLKRTLSRQQHGDSHLTLSYLKTVDTRLWSCVLHLRAQNQPVFVI